jgi:hypothetical protein
MTGRLMPKQHKEPYMARVDLAGEDDMSITYVKVQISFTRQILNLYRQSMIAPLFTKTGIMPL